MLFFTADDHFNHENIIKYCHRPFADLKQMHEALISRWNSKVSDSDTVFVLGDFSFRPGKAEEILKELSGKKILILGSHDRLSYAEQDLFAKVVSGFFTIAGPETDITMCHYQMRVWPKSHYNTWHLFGHAHGRGLSFGKSLDVGVDCHEFAPISMDEVVLFMHDQEDNENFIPESKRRVR